VTREGRVKLVDFGIAKHLDPSETEISRTRTGAQLMTPAYAAPEQLRGEATGVYTDVYALGIVLYEMLAGTVPFDITGRTPGESEAMILTAAPERPSVAARATTQGADVPASSWADLDVLCFTAMHRDAGRRYRTVEALIRDIDHFLRQEPLEARPDSTSYRAGKFVRRHRSALAIATGVLAMLVATGVVSAGRIRTARDAALVEADRAQRIQRFTLSLFAGGNESSEPGDSLRAVTLVERGVVEAATLGSEPVVQAELYQTLGGIFQKLGQLDRADTLLQQALRARRRLAPDHPDVARSLVALGLLRVDQSRLSDAEQFVREGLALSRRVRPTGHLDIAVATTALGRVLEERATYTEAIAVMREALQLHTAIAPISPDVITAATQLGNDFFYAGDYDGADSLFRHSMTVARTLYGDRHPLVADALINRGAVHFQRADYAQAERFDRDGLAIMQFVYGIDDPRTAAALTMLGRALVAQTRFAEAGPLVRQALAIQERVYGVVSPKVASTVNELGIMALREKKYDDADAYFARNADIYREVFKRPHNLLATALANRGSVFTARGDYVQAERYLREAIAVFRQTVAPTHVDIGIARVKLGRILMRQRRFSEAERESAAGLSVLLPQMSPTASWVKNARADLAQMYDSLGQTAQATAMRAAQADTLTKR
jgi:serine/threonine-protein kinase